MMPEPGPVEIADARVMTFPRSNDVVRQNNIRTACIRVALAAPAALTKDGYTNLENYLNSLVPAE